MKNLFILLTLTLFITSCTRKNIGIDTSFSKGDLKKMKSRDFDAQLTLEIMDGDLKGTHVFKFDKNVNRQIMNIGVERGLGVKDDIAKRGSLIAMSVHNPDATLLLKLHSKQFKGIITESKQPAYVMKKGELSALTIIGLDKGKPWVKAKGRLQTHNDIVFSKVGAWTNIKGKSEVRRVEGTYIDMVRFEYYDTSKRLKVEEVTVKFAFSYVQSYHPLLSPTL